VRIALLTEGGYPYARGESARWCDRLLRGLASHEFDLYALSRSERQEAAGRCDTPPNVGLVRTAPLWGAPQAARPVTGGHGRRVARRFGESFRLLAEAVCAADGPADDPVEHDGHGDGPADGAADRFSSGLHGLADLARAHGDLTPLLRSEQAVRILEAACRAPGALRAAHAAQVVDLLTVTDRLERALRPLSLDWYGDGTDGGLAEADLCHVVGAGPAVLPALVAQRAFGTPLLVTEYGVRLREYYLSSAAGAAGGVSPADAVAPGTAGAAVRALLASFQGRLAREAYARAQLITPGNTHARRWQLRCGARREKLRTVYPGMDATPFAELGEEALAPTAGLTDDGSPPVLTWVGRIEPAKDLVALLHAFAEVRREVPQARLRIVSTARGRGSEAAAYEAHCRVLAAQLFPDEAPGAYVAGENPVAFEEIGSPELPTPADAYAAACVVVQSSVIEGFPVPLVEAMFCGRATVSTDAGAVCEVIGGTGLVVPPRNPRALAESCVALLRDPARRARLGAAARTRALELFTVEQNTEAVRGIYLELISRSPSRHAPAGGAQPFARPAEAYVPGRWAGTTHDRAGAAAGGRRPGAPVPVGAPHSEEEAG
jgi:hypothetical protein